MKEADIIQLIDKAKEFLVNSYVPCSGVPVGACVLTDENLLYGGCSIENIDLISSVSAPEVAVLKAVSEGQIALKALAVYASETTKMPYLNGKARQMILQFAPNAIIIVANETNHETFKAYELLPYPYEDLGE